MVKPTPPFGPDAPRGDNSSAEPEGVVIPFRRREPRKDIGEGDPRSGKLADLRKRLKGNLLGLREYHKPGDANFYDLYTSMQDILELAASARPDIPAFVEAALTHKQVDRPDLEYYARVWVRGNSILSNALDRAHPESPDVLDEFKHDHPTPVWSDPQLEPKILGAISSAFEVIKIFCGRETAVTADGSMEEKRAAALRDREIAQEWLSDLSDEILVQAGVVGGVTKRTNASAVTRRDNKIVDFKRRRESSKK